MRALTQALLLERPAAACLLGLPTEGAGARCALAVELVERGRR